MAASKPKSGNNPKGKAISLDNLLTSVKNNEFLEKQSPAQIDFGFANCKTEEDEENLLHVYTTIIQVFKCNTTALHEASGRGKLAEFIEAEFKKAKQLDGYFGEWFIKNKHLVKNPNTKS